MNDSKDLINLKQFVKILIINPVFHIVSIHDIEKYLLNVYDLRVFVGFVDLSVFKKSNIHDLHLFNQGIHDNRLKDLANIHSLYLKSCHKYISDDGLQYLSRVKRLFIEFNDNITDLGINQYLSNIHTLSIRYCQGITNEGLKNLKKIHYLDISGIKSINDDGLKYLSSTSIHTFIANYDDPREDVAMKEIPKKLRKKCVLQSNNINMIGDRGLGYLPKSIYRLEVNYSNSITDSGLEHLSRIHILQIHGNANITDAGLKHLSHLRIFGISKNGNVTDVGIKYIENTLRKIHIYKCKKVRRKTLRYLKTQNIKIISRDDDLFDDY